MSDRIRVIRSLPTADREPSATFADAIAAASGVEILTLLTVAALGLLQVPTPFGGDQALFALGADSIHRGAVLYRDFWDLKQPGIFWFYVIAGRFFSLDAVGIHGFELLYQLAFCAVLIATLRKRFAAAGFACLAALFTVGMYYSISDQWELTQVESLVGFPLYLALWLGVAATKATPRAARWLSFGAGLAGGVVVLFKLMFLVVVVLACWFSAAVAIGRRDRHTNAIEIAVSLAFGFFIPLLVATAYFGVEHATQIAWQTMFDDPRRIVATFPAQSPSVLMQSLRWFIHGFAPVVVLAAIGAVASLRRKRDPLTLSLILWIIVGVAVILAQRQSWWSYQTLLVVTPFGIFAADGVDWLWQTTRRRGLLRVPWQRATFAVAAAVLFAVPAHASIQRLSTLAQHGFAIRAGQRRDYQQAVSAPYRTAYTSAQFLSRPNVMRGDIYVCGNPLIYTISGRRQAIPINGWLLELLLPEQWQLLVAQLEHARPSYIYMWNGYAALVPLQPHVFTRFVATQYRAVQHDGEGTWYERDATTVSAPRHHR